MKTIVTMTLNPAIDKSSRVDHVVAERKLYCKPPRFEPGGGGVNVSRAIKKLGGESLLFHPAGGLTGDRLKELLDQEGLNYQPFPIAGMIQESLVILEESSGRQYRFGMPGPALQKAEWEPFLQELLCNAQKNGATYGIVKSKSAQSHFLKRVCIEARNVVLEAYDENDSLRTIVVRYKKSKERSYITTGVYYDHFHLYSC